jgi:signal recognition particle GTPase
MDMFSQGLEHLLEFLPQARIGLSMYNFKKLNAKEEEQLYDNYKDSLYLSLLIRKYSKFLNKLDSSEDATLTKLDEELMKSLDGPGEHIGQNSSLLSVAYAITDDDKYYNKIQELLLREDFPVEYKTCMLEHLQNQQRFQDLDMKDIENFYAYLQNIKLKL